MVLNIFVTFTKKGPIDPNEPYISVSPINVRSLSVFWYFEILSV